MVKLTEHIIDGQETKLWCAIACLRPC